MLTKAVAILRFRALPWAVQADAQTLLRRPAFQRRILLRQTSVLRHAVGFDFERRLPAIRGEGEIIRREIEPRKSVVSAPFLSVSRSISPCHTSLCLKSMCFQKLRFAGLPKLFVARADAIPDDRGDDRLVVQFFGDTVRPLAKRFSERRASENDSASAKS